MTKKEKYYIMYLEGRTFRRKSIVGIFSFGELLDNDIMFINYQCKLYGHRFRTQSQSFYLSDAIMYIRKGLWKLTD